MEIVRKLVRRAGVRMFGSAPAAAIRLRRIKSADPLIILNLHRISPSMDRYFPSLSPQMFDRLLEFAKRHFSLISFSELGERFSKPRLILSFDDGYGDFMNHAMPLLAKHGVRANQNVVPACVDSGLPPLQVLVANFFSHAPEELILRLKVPGFDMRKPGQRWSRLDAFLRALRHSDQKVVADVLIPQMMSWDGFRPISMLNRTQVSEVSKEHDVGGHSFDHASMANETDDYLREDVQRCQAWFKKVTRRPMCIYAFPNGSCRPNQPGMVRKMGVDHVLLTSGAFNSRDGIHDRIGMAAMTDSELRFRALGGRASLRKHRSAA